LPTSSVVFISKPATTANPPTIIPSLKGCNRGPRSGDSDFHADLFGLR
jgi:hypothetical protein